MAKNDSTVAEIINCFDVLTHDLATARAILDCAKVLVALERAPTSLPTSQPSNAGAIGAGFAGGYTLSDKSLPELLHHGMTLIDLAHNEADLMREKALDQLSPHWQAGS
jgi:hypothetical protein